MFTVDDYYEFRVGGTVAITRSLHMGGGPDQIGCTTVGPVSPAGIPLAPHCPKNPTWADFLAGMQALSCAYLVGADGFEPPTAGV